MRQFSPTYPRAVVAKPTKSWPLLADPFAPPIKTAYEQPGACSWRCDSSDWLIVIWIMLSENFHRTFPADGGDQVPSEVIKDVVSITNRGALRPLPNRTLSTPKTLRQSGASADLAS